MYGDDEKRFKALCEQACSEEDLEKVKQVISEILAILEANEMSLRQHCAESSDDKTS